MRIGSQGPDGLDIVLDGYWWDEGPEALRRHVHGLAGGWVKAFPQDRLTVVARRRPFTGSGDLPGGSAAPDSLSVVRCGLWPHPLSNALVLPMIARQVRADVVVAQNFCPPWGRRRDVFMHDLLCASNPEWFTRSERAYLGWMPRLGRRAGTIFTSSEVEADRIRRYVPGATIVVVGQGVEDFATGASHPVPGLEPSRFLMSLGRLNARKNLGLALEGALISGVISPSFPLVIAGQPHGLGGKLPDWTDEAIADGTLRFLGCVSDEQLRWLLRHTAALLFPSRDEGFGLPPLEARTTGTQVITSDIPVLRETLGGEATYVDPDDPHAMAAAIRNVLRSGERPPSEVAGRYSWTRTATAIRRHAVGLV